MNSILRNIRTGFNRQAEGTSVNTNQQRVNGSPNPSPTAFSPVMPPLVQSTSFSSNTGSIADGSAGTNSAEIQVAAEPPKFFFREKYAKLGVKGNFMPLAAQPTNVSLPDWLAHQTVENYRLVSVISQVIQEVDTKTGKAICNPETCPKMTAGRHVYTWLDARREPIPVAAQQYIALVQRWMNGKIHDERAFPTDPPVVNATGVGSNGLGAPNGGPPAAGTSDPQSALSVSASRDWFGKSAGFPETFLNDVRTCFRQIFRVYAHLYHSHWMDPFWHLSGQSNGAGYTDLNSCFVHFCSVAKLYGLLSERDAEPMQPLIDIWVANGSIPVEAVNGTCAVAPPS